MISYRIGFSEWEHRRASNGQHARKPLSTESCPACQVLSAVTSKIQAAAEMGTRQGNKAGEQNGAKLFWSVLSHRDRLPRLSAQGAQEVPIPMQRLIAAIL